MSEALKKINIKHKVSRHWGCKYSLEQMQEKALFITYPLKYHRSLSDGVYIAHKKDERQNGTKYDCFGIGTHHDGFYDESDASIDDDSIAEALKEGEIGITKDLNFALDKYLEYDNVEFDAVCSHSEKELHGGW